MTTTANKKVKKEEIKVLKTWDSSYMTIPQLRDKLVKEFKETEKGKPINIFYTHLIVNQRCLSYGMGGNKLQVRMFNGVKVVKILDEKREERKSTGRPKGSKELVSRRKNLV